MNKVIAERRLFILDLDHTLIYTSFSPICNGHLILKHTDYMWTYIRPFSKSLIDYCHENGDVIVYTTSLRKYAHKICKNLNIFPIELLSRRDCKLVASKRMKVLKEKWMQTYSSLFVIDDSPNVWEVFQEPKVHFYSPNEFHGEESDMELLTLMDNLSRSIRIGKYE